LFGEVCFLPISDIRLGEFLRHAPCGLFREHPVVARG
jgi:hypothetical protein